MLYAQTDSGQALWVTSWPYPQFTHHAWAGAWICSCFRNEGAGKASELIRDAVAATRQHFGETPPLGMVTFVNREKVKPIIVHGMPDWGWTFKKAGFHVAGETKRGLLTLQLLPEDMPPAEKYINYQYTLF